ncbi:MAG: hypothetical protein GVY29_05135 [Spirochaetes bacterium]|jgi:hypothetical protein|nr:hypothetical protein [Spirochaetota bacterium]
MTKRSLFIRAGAGIIAVIASFFLLFAPWWGDLGGVPLPPEVAVPFLAIGLIGFIAGAGFVTEQFVVYFNNPGDDLWDASGDFGPPGDDPDDGGGPSGGGDDAPASPEQRTSASWNEKYGEPVMDPDGWWGLGAPDWGEDKITEDEFVYRMLRSTCRFVPSQALLERRYLIEEATGVDPRIWNALDFTLSDETNQLIALGSPDSECEEPPCEEDPCECEDEQESSSMQGPGGDTGDQAPSLTVNAESGKGLPKFITVATAIDEIAKFLRRTTRIRNQRAFGRLVVHDLGYPHLTNGTTEHEETTDEALADDLGISTSTLYDWRRRDEYAECVSIANLILSQTHPSDAEAVQPTGPA